MTKLAEEFRTAKNDEEYSTYKFFLKVAVVKKSTYCSDKKGSKSLIMGYIDNNNK